jgi:hypothetical protein
MQSIHITNAPGQEVLLLLGPEQEVRMGNAWADMSLMPIMARKGILRCPVCGAQLHAVLNVTIIDVPIEFPRFTESYQYSAFEGRLDWTQLDRLYCPKNDSHLYLEGDEIMSTPIHDVEKEEIYT